jgi:Nuclease-related domain
MALYMALRESPPWHIEKWRVGEEGERRMAKALRHVGPEWEAWHDLPGRNGTNVDHVVLGTAGLFLLDSKNYSGQARIESGDLRVRWLEDPEDGWVYHGMVSRMRAGSAELKEWIEEATGVWLWVQPVVVLWMPFRRRRGVGRLLRPRGLGGRLAPRTRALGSTLRCEEGEGLPSRNNRSGDRIEGNTPIRAPEVLRLTALDPARPAFAIDQESHCARSPALVFPNSSVKFSRAPAYSVGGLGEHLNRLSVAEPPPQDLAYECMHPDIGLHRVNALRPLVRSSGCGRARRRPPSR